MPRLFLSFAVAIGAGLVQPALAAEEPAARVAKCGTTSCLVVSGRRADAALPVRVNGHEVQAEGGRRWRVRVPVATVRAWSEPLARTIAVSVGETRQEVALPIGLLGHSHDLAMLVVRVK